jgi:hypothetical protein
VVVAWVEVDFYLDRQIRQQLLRRLPHTMVELRENLPEVL